MKVLDIKPVTMAEAKDTMAKREKERELGYEQKIAASHLKKFTKLSPADARKLLGDVNGVLRMSPETAVAITNLLPKSPDELRLIFAREKFSLKEDEVSKILELVKKYA
jgi:DNA-directed RNA polymerase subunit F